MVGICDHDVYAPVDQSLRALSKALLISPRKQFCIVFQESIVSVTRDVRRIQIDPITFLRFLDYFCEVTHTKLRLAELAGSGVE